MTTQNDPAVVRSEYADERGLAARFSIYDRKHGPDPRELVFDAIASARPRRVLEVGCGRGELAERIARELGAEVRAVDQSERMVELTRARGIDARIADVQALPFGRGDFDVASANWMLYHVPELDRGLTELARVLRPGGRLVAATNGVRHLGELWDLVGRDLSERRRLFMRETGLELLAPHFARVERIEVDGWVDMSAADMRDYVAASVAHKHLAGRVPDFEGAMRVATSGAVFVAETSS
jgi:SAM-dependent methyltransferase